VRYRKIEFLIRSVVKYLILGRGYTGKFLDRFLIELGHEVVSTSRSDSGLVNFVLEDHSTWDSLPRDCDGTFFTLAVKDSKLIKRFLSEKASQLGKIVFIGSTSGFLVTEYDQIVTETTALDRNNLRVQAEYEIRLAGGVCVISAGIYGPERSPLRWVKEGRISPNRRFVNFIHVEDLTRILYKAMLSGNSGDIYLASDGQPMRWSEIIRCWGLFPGKTAKGKTPVKRTSKRIDPTTSLKTLNIILKHANVIEGVKSIES